MGIVDDVVKGLAEFGNMARASVQARERAWRQVAAERGGVYRQAQPGFLSYRPPCIDVTVDDVAAHVDTYTVRGKNSSTTYTRFRAGYLLPVGPVFKVVPDNVISSLGTAIGFEDVLLGGHPEFDARFVVRSADAPACRQAWTVELKNRMLRFLPTSSVRADGHTVELTTVGRLSDVARLRAGIDVVAGIGAYGSSWAASLRSLPGAVWVAPRGEWKNRTPPSVRLDVRGVRLWVYPVLAGVGLTFCAAADLRREGAPFELVLCADGTLDASAAPEGFLPQSPDRLLAPVGPSALSYDGRSLRLVLHGELTEARVLAATKVLSDVCLGSAPRGAYR